MSRVFSTLSTGSTGTDVIVLQSFLRAMQFRDSSGKKIEVDGEFGSRTAYALTKFQQFCKACGQDVTVSGRCDSKTWKLIIGD